MTAILDEIVVTHAAQVAIEEMGLAIATHPGLKRERNEDRVAVARVVAPNAQTYTIALVCDGVGGSEAGDQAASIAIASVIAQLAQQQSRPPLKDLAHALVRRADDDVRTELQGRGTTTLVMLLATAGGGVVCASVGDSRAYSWNPKLNELKQVTIDDTIENELKDLPGNPNALIQARGLQGRLSQAIGEDGRNADELHVQIYTEECFQHGVLLGTDGLWRASKDFERVAARANTPMDVIRRATALANWVGGVDNVSLIAIFDVERLSGASGAPPHGRLQPGVSLWSPSVNVKFLTAGWIRDLPSHQIPAKTEKPKRTARKKAPRQSADESQLALEAIDYKDMKPKIEVIIGEEPKKD